MKSSLCLVLLIVSVTSVVSQSITHVWSARWGNEESNSGPVITTDSMGNIYSAGIFRGSVDFDPGVDEAIMTSQPFVNEIYLSKIDSQGVFQWVIRVAASFPSTVRDIDFDPQGYLLLTGDYSGTADFDPGPDEFILSTTGSSSDTYVLKLTTDGTFVWAVSTQGTGQKYGDEIALDGQGNVYVAGIFIGTGDFNPGPDMEVFTALSFVDGFIMKLDSQGDFIWARHHRGSFQVALLGMEADREGNLYVGGAFDDRRDFDPGPDSTILIATGAWDGFLQKLDPDGYLVWVIPLSNGGDNFIFDLITHTSGDLVVTGRFTDTLDFDPGPDRTNLNAILQDIFVARYTTDADLVWARSFTGNSFDRGNAIAVDRLGNIYTTGYFGDTIDMDPGNGTHLLISTGKNDTDDSFVSMLDADGKFIYGGQVGGTGQDAGSAIAVDGEDHIVIAGSFFGDGGFYPDDSAADSLVSAGLGDVYLARWKQCLPTSSTLSVASCEEVYESPSGNYNWTVDGVYFDTLVNHAGCDSVITIQLRFVTINTQVGIIPELPNLLALEEDAQYQWLDCLNGYTPVPGATSQEFVADMSGQYAVMLTKENCIDTSDCYGVTTAIEELSDITTALLYPNPCTECFELLLHQAPGEYNVVIRSLDGVVRWKEKRFANNQSMICPDIVKGGYLVEIHSRRKISTTMLVKL